jgi:hypothetical protein
MALDQTDLIAAAKKLWGEPTSKHGNEWRFRTHGSKSIDIKDLVWYDHELEIGGGVVELCQQAGIKGNGFDANENAWTIYDYRDEKSELLFQVVRKPGHKFLQRRLDGNGKPIWNLDGVRRVLYRLPQLIASTGLAFIVEGEKDADNLAAIGFVATTNPGGAGKWRPEYAEFFKGRGVVILPDNDEAGREHADDVRASLAGIAKSVCILDLPGLDAKGDVSDWIAKGGTHDALLDLVVNANEQPPPPPEQQIEGASVLDFYAVLEEHKYLFRPTGAHFPQLSVNTALAKINGMKPARWLDKNRAVYQKIWAPGKPEVVDGMVLIGDTWMPTPGRNAYNTFRMPPTLDGDQEFASPWLEHVYKLYGEEQGIFVINTFAYKLQHIDDKVNFALIFGGNPYIGKDTLLHPIKRIFGSYNCATISPQNVMGDFNGFRESLLIHISEMFDLGDTKMYQLNNRLKDLIAAPPDVLMVNKKNINAYPALNLCLVVGTTNHRSGIHISKNDRRYYPVWSNLSKGDFTNDYFIKLYRWLDKDGGIGHVAAYLRSLDVSEFQPKAYPPQTEWYLDAMNQSQPTEAGMVGTILDAIGRPDTVTIAELISHAHTAVDSDAALWLGKRENRKFIHHCLVDNDYRTVHNLRRDDHLWKIGEKPQMVYAKSQLTEQQQQHAARSRANSS